MISYEDKIKSDNLNNYFAINEQKLVIKEIKHLKFDLMQLESKRRMKLASLKKTCDGRISKRDLRLSYHTYKRTHKLKGVSDIVIKRTLEEEFGATDSYDNSSNSYYWEGVNFR